ncbi:thioredoxin family protein [Lactiplantibacillus plantarum]|uniref:thioredoxin family protein n=1 Tax=Lactiplantibacillus plantarum TaxID=1590 RepID=UPI002001C1A3|nr:thioredoxin family protein [Lactiplantibacillus plantarum]MCK3677839.1 thioredoxin family protein [Lactiplantibacillus plantarum]
MSTIDKTLTLINFENNWCAQCYTQRPIINKISHDFNSYLNVRVVNSDAHPELAKKYNVYSAPSTILLRDGKIVEKITRSIDQSQLTTLIKYYL